MKTQAELEKMSNADLASYYNGLTGAKVNRFASKAAALKRVQEAQADLNAGKKPKVEKRKPAKGRKAGTLTDLKKGKLTEPKKVLETDLPRASTVYVRKAGNKSWTQYRSVKVAFEELDLPLGIHQGFRKDLKIEGEQVIGDFTFESRDKHHGIA